MIYPDSPAFPRPSPEAQEGIDIRTYLAAKAMQGILLHDIGQPYVEVARKSVAAADALLTELNKTQP